MKPALNISPLLLAAIVSLAFLACGNKKEATKKPVTFNPISHKTCNADTTQSYEVYLPKAYLPPKQMPVIYVFDPHGDGKLAVEHFKEAAEHFGYIIVGSNNSKNGAQTLDYILNILLTDAGSSFAIHPGRQYAGGFSGGGRVASYLALKTGIIKGIITCGAGLGDFKPQMAKAKFAVYAIAGREDFNYDEVMSIPQLMGNTDWRYITAAFDGTHAWPAASFITNAVLWFQLNAMKDDAIPKDKGLIEQALDSANARCEKQLDLGYFMRAANECQTGITFLGDLVSTKKLKENLKEIKNMDGYFNEIRKTEQYQTMEQQLKNGYVQSFGFKDLDWWKSELNSLKNNAEQEKDIDARQMYRRLKGFLGIVCYSYTTKALNENHLELANKCIGIYKIVEPQNPDCFFYKAVLLEKKNRAGEAAAALKKAIEFGFKDAGKIRKEISGKTLELANISL